MRLACWSRRPDATRFLCARHLPAPTPTHNLHPARPHLRPMDFEECNKISLPEHDQIARNDQTFLVPKLLLSWLQARLSGVLKMILSNATIHLMAKILRFL